MGPSSVVINPAVVIIIMSSSSSSSRSMYGWRVQQGLISWLALKASQGHKEANSERVTVALLHPKTLIIPSSEADMSQGLIYNS